MIAIQGIHIGKVRNSMILNNETRIIQTSDRISAFDYIFPFTVKNKAKILQAISVWFFKQSEHIIENNLIGCLSETEVLVKEAKVFPIEIIVRRYLTGSLWRLYLEKGSAGVYDCYGIKLPENLSQNCKLESAIITPSTKAEAGHDIPINCQKAEQIVGAKNWEQISKKALELFAFGEAEALKKGLILVDTKYEMGLYQDRLILVDEVHTPDSSRYWIAENFNATNPKQLSKEFLREELIKILGKPEEFKENPCNHPLFKDENKVTKLAAEISLRYNEMFEKFIGNLDNINKIYETTKCEWPISTVLFNETIQTSILPKKVLVVGNGGRDYSIYHNLTMLPEIQNVYCACGPRKWESEKFIYCPHQDVEEIAQFAAENNIGLVIAGPEMPIAQGLEQACSNRNIPVLSPSLECASLESSKILCKDLIHAANVPTAESVKISWNNLKIELENFLKNQNNSKIKIPCVLKYDGLAAGKGVFVLTQENDVPIALETIEQNIDDWQKLSNKTKTNTYSKIMNEAYFLIENILIGEEISVIALCNDKEFRLLPIARDYKRRNNGQKGPNTGGMGSVCPVPLNNELMKQVKNIFQLTLNELHKRNTPYYGFLFAGFMVDKQNKAWLLEYNCRLGDPETQVLLPGLQRDFYIELYRTALKKKFVFSHLNGQEFLHDNLKRVFVVGAAPEYPEKTSPRRSVCQEKTVKNNDEVQIIPTAIEPNETSTGGRIFGVLATAKDFSTAKFKAYETIAQFYLKDENSNKIKPHFRTDIAAEFDSSNINSANSESEI